MASLLRVSPGFARQVAAAPVARFGSGGAAPSEVPQSHRLLSFFFLRGGRAMSSDVSSGTTTPHKDKDIVHRFVAVDKDLESDEALWALYERWCKHFDEERDHDEMLRWFPKFKETALRVDRVNKANLPYKFGFNQFADGKLFQLCSCRTDYDDLPYSDSPMFDPDSPMFGTARRRWRGCPESARDESKDGHPA